jgi:hypothetical protein
MRLELAALGVGFGFLGAGVGVGILGAGPASAFWQGIFGNWQRRRKEEHREERKKIVREAE